jgi:hypothetical protein
MHIPKAMRDQNPKLIASLDLAKHPKVKQLSGDDSGGKETAKLDAGKVDIDPASQKH